MLEHRVGKRREVEILAEQLLSGDRRRDLEERAFGAQHEIERKLRLGLAELRLRQEGVCERRVAKREDWKKIASTAGATFDYRIRHSRFRRTCRYQSTVRFSPSSRENSGCHPSRSRARLALRY